MGRYWVAEKEDGDLPEAEGKAFVVQCTCAPGDKHAERYSVNARWRRASEAPRQRDIVA